MLEPVMLMGRLVAIDDFHFESDVVDSYISKAFWVDNGTPLFDDDLEKLNDLYGELIYDEWFQYKLGEAEALYDRLHDR